MRKKLISDKKDVLASFLPGLVKEKGWEVQVELHSLFLDWREIVGEIADYASPDKIKKNVLFIQVGNSAWMQQLQYRKVELLDRLNRRLKLSQVVDIRFTLADRDTKEPDKQDSDTIRFEPPPKEKQEAFRNQINSIKDEDVRESLMRIWYLSQACKRND